MDGNDVNAILLAHLADLRTRFGVRRLRLFGSMARGEAGPDSDVDLIVEFDHAVGYFDLFPLQDHLADLLGRRVDLTTPDGLKHRLRDRILREARDVA